MQPRMTPDQRRVYKRQAMYAAKQVECAVGHGLLADLRMVEIPCKDCSINRATVYDHRDYANPLDVTPVCASCNSIRGSAVFTLLGDRTGDAQIACNQTLQMSDLQRTLENGSRFDFICKRSICGHKWVGRIDRKPLRCPACGSPKWNQA